MNTLIGEVFLAGVSTRRVGAVLEGLPGEPVSAQTVSRMARSLDREVARFHEAPLSDDLMYLSRLPGSATENAADELLHQGRQL